MYSIVDLFYSVCKRAWWQVETSEWFSLRTIWLRKRLSDSFMTICSQLNRALLRAPIHQSLSISPNLFLSPVLLFSIILSKRRPVCFGSINNSLQPSLNLFLSKSIHCIFSASRQSGPIVRPVRQLDGQVQSPIYLSFDFCQPSDALTCLWHRKEPLATKHLRCPSSQRSAGSQSFLQ